MDLTNLSNRQQSAIINVQSRIQSMFNDQAAANAARQFNASSENQVNQFFAQLGTSVDLFNSGQQFDAATFNAKVQEARDQFNSQNSLLIEQANVEYLRRINTANTALVNQANMFEAQNLLGISNTAIANSLTLLRDEQAYAFQSSESTLERQLRVALAEMQIDATFELASKTRKFATGAAVGNLAGNILNTAVGGIFDSIGDDGGNGVPFGIDLSPSAFDSISSFAADDVASDVLGIF
jgi:hypothetical protein